VPKEVAAVDEELVVLKVRYEEVCTCIRRLDGEDRTKFVEHIRSRIASVLSDSQLERWCQEYVRAQLQKANGKWDKNSLVACLRGVQKAMADLAENFKDAHTHFSLLFETALAVEFNKASCGGVGDPEKFIDLRPYHHVLGCGCGLFLLLDKDKDGQLSRQEYEAGFDMIDIDKDGKISQCDITAATKALPGMEAMSGFVQKLDTDGDGKLSKPEYNAGFDVIDADKDGFITRSEFGTASLAPFSMLDKDGDGKLSRTEYEDVLQVLRGFLAKKSTELAKKFEAGNFRESLAAQLIFHRADYFRESVSCASLEASVCALLLQDLLLPCVQGVGDREPTMPWLPCPAACAAGVSVFKQVKKKLEEQMQTCNEVKKSLRDLC
jgi:Ca2+-binding EF-hand superfamily protein